ARQPAETLRAYADAGENRALGRFVRLLLRLLPPEAWGGWAEVDLAALERKAGLDRSRLLRGLAYLAERDLLAVHPPTEGLRVVFSVPRTMTVGLVAAALGRCRRRGLARLSDVLRSAGSLHRRRCRLLHYFGEASPPRCGRCDVCLGRHRPAAVTPEDEPLL